MKTRASIGWSIVVLLGSTGLLRADLSSASSSTSARAASTGNVELARLMPSYTLSYLTSVGTPDSAQAIAQQKVGAVNLTSNQVFYSGMTVADGSPNGGLGPGGDGSADLSTLPPPAVSHVPAPGALGLGILGMAFISSRRRGRSPA